MTREETKIIVDRVKANRQFFSITELVYSEWHRFMVDYDFKDISEQLDKFLLDFNGENRLPSAQELIKNCKTIIQKNENKVDYKVFCSSCNKIINFKNYEQHLDKCNSINYIVENMKKYFKKNIDRRSLWQMNQQQFEKTYWNFCEQLYPLLEDGRDKKSLSNAIETHYGKEPKFILKEVL